MNETDVTNSASSAGSDANVEGVYTRHSEVPQEPVLQDEDDNDDDDVRRSAVLRLKEIIQRSAAEFPLVTGEATTWMSISLMAAHPAFPVEIPIVSAADFVNALGEATVAAGLVDVQFSLTKRTSKSPRDLEAIYGIIVDVDRPTTDALGEVERAAVDTPTFMFGTLGGFKPAYCSATAIPVEVFIDRAQRLTLAHESGDAKSWEPGQMQRLPTCLKTVDGEVVHVTFAATLTNGVPFDAAQETPFPRRVLRALGKRALDEVARREVSDYLASLGIPAPEQPGSILYAACPVADRHGSPCCYVHLRDDGEIFAHCLGGHGGEGAKHFSEHVLAELAGAVANRGGDGPKRFDPLRHLPVTAAAEEYIRHRLREWDRPQVEAALSLWTHEYAQREARRLGGIPEAEVLSVLRQRVFGLKGLPAMSVYYDRGAAQLVHDLPDGGVLQVNSKNGPNLKTNSIELKSNGLFGMLKIRKKDVDVVEPGWVEDAPSYLHKMAAGHGHVLALMGVPAITTYALPVAHAVETWGINPAALYIEAVVVRATLDDVEEIDAIVFFLALFHAGRLPLASENDVRLFVMALASPFLRHTAPGLLGVYWFVAPPGVGKDYLAEMLRRIWESCAPRHMRVSFDLSLAGALEQKRMFEMGAGCVYARAKEAGKRQGMTDALIQFAGTDMLAGRGLFKEEVSVPNSFTYIAESAEDMPERREISRRTVLITCSAIADSVSKGEVLEEVRAAGPGLLKYLKRMVESNPPEWYLRQANTSSRPVIPVALSRLFGATPPAVEGEDLTEVYEAMLAFTTSLHGKPHGVEQRETLRRRPHGKVSLEARTLPSFSLAFFIASMVEKPGMNELFSPYSKKSKELVNRIQRETDYRVGAKARGYMAVEIQGKQYALRIEDGRRYILVPQLEYDTAMKDARAAAAASAGAPPPPVSPIGGTSVAADASATDDDALAESIQEELLKKAAK